MKVTQSCPTLWDPMDCSPPGSSVHGILQARVLEWVAMPSSRGVFPTQGSNLPSLISLLLWQAGSLPLAKGTINCSLETSEGVKQISLGSCFYSKGAAAVLVYFWTSHFSSDSCTKLMRDVIYFRNTLWPWPNICHYHLTLNDSPHPRKYLKTFLL